MRLSALRKRLEQLEALLSGGGVGDWETPEDLSGTWEQISDEAISYRLEGEDVVRFKGQAAVGSGNTMHNSLLLRLPEELRPTRSVNIAAVAVSDETVGVRPEGGTLRVQGPDDPGTHGEVRLYCNDSATGGNIRLDGVTFVL